MQWRGPTQIKFKQPIHFKHPTKFIRLLPEAHSPWMMIEIVTHPPLLDAPLFLPTIANPNYSKLPLRLTEATQQLEVMLVIHPPYLAHEYNWWVFDPKQHIQAQDTPKLQLIGGFAPWGGFVYYWQETQQPVTLAELKQWSQWRLCPYKDSFRQENKPPKRMYLGHQLIAIYWANRWYDPSVWFSQTNLINGRLQPFGLWWRLTLKMPASNDPLAREWALFDPPNSLLPIQIITPSSIKNATAPQNSTLLENQPTNPAQ